MTTTPLYTRAELAAEIAQAKKDLAAARHALSYSVDTGGSRRQAQREQIKALQDHLVWLQQQRVALGLKPGPQAIVGRVHRG